MKKHLKTGALVLLALLIVLLGMYGISTAGVSGSVTALSISPDPIRLGSTATVQYALNQAGAVSVNVYNSNGNLIRTLQDNTSKNAGTWTLSWDGTNNSGVLVPDGSYKFTVEEKDSTGDVVGSADITKTAAVVPAISALTDSPDPFNPAVGEKVSINYTLSSNALVTVTILNGYTPVKTICANVSNNAGVNTVEWDGTDATGKIAGDAAYTYQIDAVSPTVATFKSTQKGTVAVEKEAPQVTSFTASPNPLKLGSNTLSISYTLSESAKVTLKIVDSTGNVKRTILDAAAKSAGSNTASWDGKDDAGVLVDEGSYNVVLNAVDAFNKPSGEKTVAVTTGCVPAISNATANPATINPNTPNCATIIGYSLSNRAVVTVQILSGYTPVKTLVNKVTQDAGAQSITWDGKDSSNPPKVVGDGSYTFQITAASPTVASFSSTYKGTVTVDKGAITITGLAVSPNPLKIGTNSLTASYTLSDAATVYVNVYNGTNLIKTLAGGVAKNAGYVSHSWDGTDNSGALVDEGTYTVTVCAVGLSKSVTASVNVVAGYVPVVTSLSSSPEPYSPSSGPATINFTLAKPAKGKLTITIGYTTIRTVDLGALAAGPNSAAWDGKDSANKVAGDGSYTYKVEATSPTVSTFIGSATGTLTVTGATPQVTSLSVSPATVKIGNTATFRYTVSEPATIKAQVLDSQGQAVRNFAYEVKSAAGSFSLTWDTNNDAGAPVAPGNYTLKITAVDTDGINGSGQLAFQAGKVPTISGVAANPQSIDITKGETSTTISYSVDVESYVTIKALDATGKVWKYLATNKKVNGSDSVVMVVYENGKAVTGTLGYTVDASSVIGYFRAQQASGNVQVGGNSSGEVSCTDCHQGFPVAHPMTNCNGCHGNDVPIQNCAACHAGISHTDGLALTKYQCTLCHNDTYSYKIPPGHGDVAVLHGTTLQADCQKCHNQSLSVEHPLHKDDNGVAYNCSTCHGSGASQTVKDAVYNRQKDCTACHGTDVSGHEAVHTPTGIQTDCTKCHKDSLTQEHLNNPVTQTGNAWTCNTCHGSTAAQTVQDAVYNGDKSCSACHGTDTGGHEAVHTPTGIETGCTNCHKDSLTQEHLNNPVTQTGNSWTCATCHGSTASQTVQDAVYNGDKSCSACHSQVNHQAVHETTILDDKCTQCHINNLVDEHLTNTKTQTDQQTGQLKGWTCNTCHGSTNSLVAGAISTDNTQCAACHRVAHGLNLAENVLADIPLYQDASDPAYPNGYIWSQPQDAFIWAGESWMPEEFVLGGKLVMSSRRTDVVASEVYNYYRDNLTVKGWAGISPAPDLTTVPYFFDVEFTKGIHKAKVMFYGGPYHDAAPLTGGYRIEILYK